jgi:FkbM family methyltransferase
VKRLTRQLLPHALYRVYRARRIARLIAGYQARETEHSYHGEVLRVHLADPLAEGWYDHDATEFGELTFLSDIGVLHPDVLVFDLGAHQGIVALVIARRVEPGGRVIAVEAERHNATVAEKNRNLNHAHNMEVVCAAVTGSSGACHFAEGLNGSVDRRTSYGNALVRSVTVDELAARYGMPGLVFLDVEGYEGHALHGATKTIGQGATCFFVEMHDRMDGYEPHDILDMLDGYVIFVSSFAPHGYEFHPLESDLPTGRFYLVAVPDGLPRPPPAPEHDAAG